jgi:hypothetical protein
MAHPAHSRRTSRRDRTSFRPRVEALEGRLLLSTYQVTNTQDAGPGSLRRAILDVNAHAGHDRIIFAIPGDGVHTIAPASALPAITRPVTLDGTMQPGFAGSPLIELDGSGAGANAAGLRITAGNSTVRGLAIGGFGRSGIELVGRGGNVIAGNDIGTNATGDTALGNAVAGIAIGPASDNNLIGGTAAGAGNLIAGNGGDGNFIGTEVTGSAALPNRNGVFVDYTGGGNTIGGTAAGADNLIAGNRASGVLLNATVGNVVQGNFVGTDVTGNLISGNGADGAVLRGQPLVRRRRHGGRADHRRLVRVGPGHARGRAGRRRHPGGEQCRFPHHAPQPYRGGGAFSLGRDRLLR